MNPEQLFQFAQQALAAGTDPAAVDRRIAETTGGAVPNFAALQAGIQSRQLKAESATLERASEHGALSNFLRMAGQGLTFGFGDELAGAGAAMIPGGQGYTEARDASRQRVEDLRAAAPGASLAAEAAGGLLVPAAAVGGALRAGSGAARAAGAGAAAGGAGGGLFGFGEAEGGAVERAQAALPAAATGAVAGGLLGAAAPAAGRAVMGAARGLRRAGGASGPRTARELSRLTGIENDIRAAIRQADEGIDEVRAQMYRPIEDAFPVVTDPEISAFLNSSPDMRAHVRSISRDVAGGQYPSLRDLQQLRTRLRRQDRDAADQLNALMQDRIEGLADADAAYGRARGTRRALQTGRQLANRSAADIRIALEALPPEGQAAFRRGMLHEITRKLEARESGAVGKLREFIDAGPETRDALRQLFPDDASFNQFREVLASERSAERVHRALVAGARWGVLAALGGAAGGAAVSALN